MHRILHVCLSQSANLIRPLRCRYLMNYATGLHPLKCHHHLPYKDQHLSRVLEFVSFGEGTWRLGSPLGRSQRWPGNFFGQQHLDAALEVAGVGVVRHDVGGKEERQARRLQAFYLDAFSR